MTQTIYSQPDAQLAERRKQLAPGIHDAFQEVSRQAFAGARSTPRATYTSRERCDPRGQPVLAPAHFDADLIVLRLHAPGSKR